jgi:hypothetical protein
MSTESLRQTTVLLAGLIVIPYCVLVLARAVQDKRRPHGNATLLPALLVGIAMVFLSRRWGPQIDAALGWPNLSWLAGYGLGAIGFYFAGLFAWRVGPRRSNPAIATALRAGLVLAIATMSILFLNAIEATPEWPSRVPRNWQEATFSTLFFGYVGAVSGLALDASVWTIVNEEHDGAAQRALFSLIGSMFALLCSVSKIVFVWLHVGGFYVGWLDRTALACFMVAILGLLGAFFPQRIHNRLAAHPPVRTWRALADLKRLEFLYEAIGAVQPTVRREDSAIPWWRRLFGVEQALYEMVIAVHDAKRVLATLPAEAQAAPTQRALLEQLASVDQLSDASYSSTLAALRRAALELKNQQS